MKILYTQSQRISDKDSIVKKSSFSLMIVQILLVTCCVMMIAPFFLKSWHDLFFKTLYSKGIESFRVVTYVEKEDLENREFLLAVGDFLREVHSRTAGAQVHISLELWLSPNITDTESQKLQEFFIPGNIKLIHTETMIAQMERTENFPSVLKKNMNSDLTKNALKIWSLSSPYEVNIYIAPELWGAYRKEPRKIKSSQAFGLTESLGGDDTVLIHWLTGDLEKKNFEQLMLIDHRFLLATGESSKLNFLKKLIAESVNHDLEQTTWLLERPLWLSTHWSLAEYEASLDERLDWLENHREISLNDRISIELMDGSLFLEKSALDLKISEFMTTSLQIPELEKDRRVRRHFWTTQDLQDFLEQPAEVRKKMRALLIQNDLEIFDHASNYYSQLQKEMMQKAQMSMVESFSSEERKYFLNQD